MNYQGYLTDAGNNPRQGTFKMEFSLFADSLGGSAIWTETYADVPVNVGVFSVVLGTVNPLPASAFDGSKLWLETTVADVTLAPRRPLITVPYSFRAQVAEVALSGGADIWGQTGTTAWYKTGPVAVGTDAVTDLGNGNPALEVDGQLVASRDNATSFRLRGKSFGGGDVESYAGVFYNDVYDHTGGPSAQKTRVIYGSNPDMDLEIQGTHDIRITAVDNNTLNGDIRMAAAHDIQLHAGVAGAETNALVATIHGGAAPGVDVSGTLIAEKDNASSFRLKGKDFNGNDVQSYAGVFYNDVYDNTGGPSAKKTRVIYGSNEDMDLEIQGSNDIRITAVDNNNLNGDIRMAASHDIQFHAGVTGAETDHLVATMTGTGLETIGFKMPTGAGAGLVLTSDASGNASWTTASGFSVWSLGGGSTAFYNAGPVAVGASGVTDLGNGNPALEVDGQLVASRDNGSSFRLRGKDFNGNDVESYAGVFYNDVFDNTGGPSAKKTRVIYGSNEDMDLEIQGSNDIRITAVDNNNLNGDIRMAASHDIQFHAGVTGAETDHLVATMTGTGLETIGLKMPTGAGAGLVLTSDASGNASWTAAPSSPWGLSGSTTYYSAGPVAVGASGVTDLGNGNPALEVNGQLVATSDNSSSFRLRGKSFGGADVESYAGVFYNDVYDNTGGPSAQKTRVIYGSNPDMDLEIQGTHDIRITAVDNNTLNGDIRLAAAHDVQIHAGVAGAETNALVATIHGGAAPGVDVSGTLIAEKDNASSFRLKGKDFNGNDVQSYAGVFYNNAYDQTGGPSAKKTRVIYGSNEDMDLEIQGSNDIRITAVDNNNLNGDIRMAASHDIQFHAGVTGAETDALVASMTGSGLSVAAGKWLAVGASGVTDLGNGNPTLEVDGQLVATRDNGSSFRLRGKSFGGADVESYAGVFYNDVYDNTGGPSAKKTRVIYGSNPDMDLEIQGSNDIRITAVDNNNLNGDIRMAASHDIQFHAGVTGAETNALVATMTSSGLALGSGKTFAIGSVTLVVGSGAPSGTPATGSLYIDATGGVLYIYNGSSWVTVGSQP